MDKEKLETIKNVKSTLIGALYSEVGNGVESLNTCEVGMVVDIIKDLAEVEKLCYEKEYYESVVEAMEEGNDEPAWEEALRMGYRGRGRNPDGTYKARMGYHPYYPDYKYPVVRYYDDNDWGNEDAARYGRAYNEYRRARRNYTESHSENDKKDMDMMGQRHVMNAIDSIRDIWEQADPSLKIQMKSDIAKLVEDMKM